MHRVGSEAPRRPAREVHHVELVERAEHQPAAVGGRGGVANLARQHLPGVGAIVEAHQGPEVLLDVRSKRDLARLPRGDLDAHDLAAVRRDQRSRVRGEGAAGHQVAREARLLIVVLHRVHEPALVARRQVAQPQPRFGVVARRIHEPLAVGGQHRAHGAAVEVGLREDASGLPVVDGELPQGILEVVAEAPAMPAHPDVARVAAERGAERVHRGHAGTRRRQLHHAGARAAVLVVQPQLVGAAEHATGARRDDVVAVRGPHRRGVQLVAALGERLGVRPVGVADPDVLTAAAVRQEHDVLSVGRVPGLRVERGPGGDARRGPAGDGHRVQVAQQLEHDRLAVGRDIEREPGAFVRVELDLASAAASRSSLGASCRGAAPAGSGLQQSRARRT